MQRKICKVLLWLRVQIYSTTLKKTRLHFPIPQPHQEDVTWNIQFNKYNIISSRKLNNMISKEEMTIIISTGENILFSLLMCFGVFKGTVA
jgi:hypothetical protein